MSKYLTRRLYYAIINIVRCDEKHLEKHGFAGGPQEPSTEFYSPYSGRKETVMSIKKYWPLLVAAMFLTLFLLAVATIPSTTRAQAESKSEPSSTVASASAEEIASLKAANKRLEEAVKQLQTERALGRSGLEVAPGTTSRRIDMTPTTRPAPTTKPATQPASRPATQPAPTSQPATQPAAPVTVVPKPNKVTEARNRLAEAERAYKVARNNIDLASDRRVITNDLSMQTVRRTGRLMELKNEALHRLNSARADLHEAEIRSLDNK